MSDEIIGAIRENVIQGRITMDDEGMNGDMAGQPGLSELIQQALDEKIDVELIVKNGLTEGMNEVGRKFEAEEFYIPDMLAAAETVGAAMELLEPYLAQSGVKSKGTVLMATVKGDMHDIGKSIVSILLRGAGYMVKDLGNDIETSAIVEAVRNEKPQYLGLSALLTSTMVNMKDVIDALQEQGLRDTVKVVIGGAPVSEEFASSIGADGYGADGFKALSVVEELNPATGDA